MTEYGDLLCLVMRNQGLYPFHGTVAARICLSVYDNGYWKYRCRIHGLLPSRFHLFVTRALAGFAELLENTEFGLERL